MREMTPELEEKLKLLPENPGVYRFLSKDGKVIYVGKAKILKNRVRSYFLDSNRYDRRLRKLLPHIVDLEWTITHTEAEALILEDQLIKTHNPRYNIRLKDGKSYPYFKLSVQEMFPRLSLVREIKRDGSLYFGPYVAVSEVRSTMKTIRRFFPLRQSSMELDGTKTHRPCLNYQMKRCLAPCAGNVEIEEYQQIVQGVLQLLKGNHDELIQTLKETMAKQAEELQFEEAGKTRDQIQAIQRTFQKQKKLSNQKIDRDVLSVIRSKGFAGVEVLFIRNGILLSQDFFFFKQGEEFDDSELLRSVLSNLYISGDKPLPKEIILPIESEELMMMEEYFEVRRDTKVKIIVPVRGEKKSWINLAEKNGEEDMKYRLQSDHADDLIMKAVRQRLHLKNLPNRVECFDISNISGTDTVASMVVWENNRAKKKDYRKYKIKTVEGSDDFASMKEVLSRRYRPEKVAEQPLPDLIIIDGGKGQLSSAMEILEENEVDLKSVDVIGLAKGRSQIRAGIQKVEEDYEYVVKPKQKNIIPLKKNSMSLFFLQNIRDEAHRFAITFHRQQRGKRAIKSQLEDIPGIGPQKRKNLLKQFGNLTKIKQATVEELAATTGISQKDAERVLQFFKDE